MKRPCAIARGAEDYFVFAQSLATDVIPGCAKRRPGIHNHDREYGFRARAKGRIPE